MPDEIRKNIGEKGRLKTMSAESRAKISKAGKGREKSLETRKKLSLARTGKSWGRHTEEMKRHFSLTRSGKNSPSWKGGVTCPRRLQRRRPQYISWRTEVFDRDDYTCQMPGCGVRGKYVEAHHIKTFKEFPEGRLDMENGITLCLSCHNKTKKREHAYEQTFYAVLNERKGAYLGF